jgi:hypothetical protein
MTRAPVSPSRLPWLSALVTLGAVLADGCASEGGGEAGIVHPTLIAVSPQDFLGDVPCAETPGAMRAYVATLIDVSPGLGADAEPVPEFRLPSAAPTSCRADVAFAFVASGHRYIAEIQGYERDALDLRPLAPGSATMLDAGGNVVEPRWKTTCGKVEAVRNAVADAGLDGAVDASVADAEAGSEPAADAGIGASNAVSGSALVRMQSTTAVSRTTRYVRACEPLESGQSLGDTGIAVELQSALGGLACGDTPGAISRFRAVLTATGASREAACTEPVVFSGLTPGIFYELFVEAFEKDMTTPRWGTRCWRETQPGVTLEATCNPLSAFGALAIDVGALLARLGVPCTTSALSQVAATLEADSDAGDPRTLVVRPPDCTAPLVFDQVPAGPQLVNVTVTLSSDASAPVATQSCTATVAAGRTTLASCL